MSPDQTTQDAYDALTAAGFSDYEAKAYCALVADSPANGYRVARASGVPRPKIYECLERLVDRGAAVRVEAPNARGALFAAVDPRVVIDHIEAQTADTCRRARTALQRIQTNKRSVEVLWRVLSRDDLITRGRKLVEGAVDTLHVAIWPEEFDALLEPLRRAVHRGVKLALVAYGPHDGVAALHGHGAGALVHSRTKLEAVPLMGKQFVVVADRRECIVGSIFPNDDVEGVFTMNRGLVINAADLVNHEIYLERILLDVGPPVVKAYGADLEGLDAFDPPRSAESSGA